MSECFLVCHSPQICVVGHPGRTSGAQFRLICPFQCDHNSLPLSAWHSAPHATALPPDTQQATERTHICLPSYILLDAHYLEAVLGFSKGEHGHIF